MVGLTVVAALSFHFHRALFHFYGALNDSSSPLMILSIFLAACPPPRSDCSCSTHLLGAPASALPSSTVAPLGTSSVVSMVGIRVIGMLPIGMIPMLAIGVVGMLVMMVMLMVPI